MNHLRKTNIEKMNEVSSPESVTSEPSSETESETGTEKKVTEVSTKIKIPRRKCNECGTRLKLIILTCKCGHIFCPTHLTPHSHNCSYDYREEKRKQLEMTNPKLGSKFVRI